MLKIKTTRDLGKLCKEVKKETGHCQAPKFFLGGNILLVGPLVYIREGSVYKLATEC